METLLVLAVMLGIFLSGNWLLRRRDRRLARKRTGQGFDQFLAYFSGESIPHNKLREVYEYLQSSHSVKDFPVLPTDDLCKVYGICHHEDLDDAVIELAQRWRADLPRFFDLERPAPVRSVADLVHFLARLPSQND